MNNGDTVLLKIGNNVKLLRKKKKISQKEMAERNGISVSQYQRIEAGLANVSIKTLVKVASYLGVGVDLLVYGEEIKKQNQFIQLQEQELIEKVKELEGLNSTDKKLAHQLLDLVIAKKRLDELVDKIHQPK